MTIDQQRELSRIKAVMHTVTDASFTYSQTSKSHPLATSTDDQIDQLLELYREILQRVSNALAEYEGL